MATNLFPINLDFTTLDQDAIRLRLQQLAKQVFPTWTDFNVANFGNILLESFAHVGDVITGLADNHASEGKVVSARLRRSMIALAKSYAYELPSAAAATVTLTFTVPTPAVNDIVIPIGTIVATNDPIPIKFQTLAAATLLASTSSITASSEQSETKQDIFSGTGEADQQYQLSFSPFLDGSATVTDDADVFIEVSNFLDSISTDRHFVIEVDENDLATIKFGDGINGEAPDGVITVLYKIGGGSVGNVEAGTLTELDGAFFDTAGESVALSVSNISAATGGIDRMTVEEARIAIPDSIRATGSRSVTREDFEINARKTRGVARSLMLTADEDVSIAENTGKLFIVPVGGGVPSAQLKTDVDTDINANTPPCLTFTFSVEDPGLKVIPVTADVFLEAGATASVVKTAIEDALDAFFNPLNADNTPNANVDFGYNIRKDLGTPSGEVPFSDVFNVVRDIAGVRKVDEDTFVPANDTTLLDSEFPVLGTITLTNGDTMAPL